VRVFITGSAINAVRKFLLATRDLPEEAGVYWISDTDGTIIYISRASNIKERLRRHLYLSKSVKDQMIQQSFAKVEYELITDRFAASKRELELIRKYYPPLNSRHEGLKQYRYIELTMTEKFPRARKKKTFETGKEIMLGPFPKNRHIQRALLIAANYFGIATCGKEVVLGDDHQIVKTCIRRRTKQCLRPCEVDVDQEEYLQALDRFSDFFKGDSDELTSYLEGQMKEAAAKQEFERAQHLKEDLQAIHKIFQGT